MRRAIHAGPAIMMVAAVATLCASIAVPHAQQQGASPAAAAPAAGQGAGRGAGQGQAAAQGGAPAAPAAKPPLPVAASSVANNPDGYIGEYVTMSASVEQLLTATAFTVDQDPTKTTGKEVLILVPNLQSQPAKDAPLTILGDVVKFDPAEVAKKAKDYKIDLPADVAAKFAGKPAVVATGVITAGFVDLAKRLPPPMTADEEALQKIMKKIGPANAALRTAVEGSKADAVAEQLTILKAAYVDTEAFWRKAGKLDAATWTVDARKQLDLLGLAATGAKWDGAKTALTTFGGSCQTCHTAYRERFDDGSFRIKKPAK